MHYPHGSLKHSRSRWCALSMTRDLALNKIYKLICKENKQFMILCYFFVLFYEIGVVNFSHVGRTGNKPAHILARQAQNLVNDVIWIEKIPCCIEQAFIQDVSVL